MNAVIDYDQPIFSRDQALMMIRADANTLDNWLRHGHVVPAGEKGRRLFSPNHLIQAEVIYSLANTFRVPPAIGKVIADDAIAEYRSFADVDILDIWSGADFNVIPNGEGERTTLSLVRGENGDLRAWLPGDRPESEITLVLPTRHLARSVFAKMKIVMDAVLSKESV